MRSAALRNVSYSCIAARSHIGDTATVKLCEWAGLLTHTAMYVRHSVGQPVFALRFAVAFLTNNVGRRGTLHATSLAVAPVVVMSPAPNRRGH